MEVNRLSSDELSYELLVRGATSEGTVDEKRQRLRLFFNLERKGELPVTVGITFNPDDEIAICEGKVSEIEEGLQNFNVDNALNERTKLKTRTLHILHRLNRVMEPRCRDDKARLTTRCVELLELIENSIELLPEPAQGASEPLGPQPGLSANNNQGVEQRSAAEFVHFLEPHISILDRPNEPLRVVEPKNNCEILAQLHGPAPMPNCDVSSPVAQRPNALHELTVSPVRQVVGHLTSRHTGNRRWRSEDAQPESQPFTEPCRRNAQSNSVSQQNAGLSELSLTTEEFSRGFKIISKWEVRFDGLTSVTNFMERVEELSHACGITSRQLLHSAIVLFTGVALSWFRSVRENIRTWEELKTKLRETYLSSESEEEIWCDIRNRTQGPNEKTAIFCAHMKNLFRKLSQPPNEDTKLRIIRRNLLPFIQNQLALQHFNTTEELESAARIVEDVQVRTQRMRPPPTNSHLVAEPECMYQRPRNSSVHVVTGAATSATLSAPGGDRSSQVTCWNCQRVGHFKGECTEPFRRHCFRCGRPDVTTQTCPVCRRSGNGAPSH